MSTAYERLRDENIKTSRATLLALELDKLKTYHIPSRTMRGAAPAAKTRKRKLLPPQDTEDEDGPDAKVSKKHAAQDITSTSGVRRSTGSAGKVTACESAADGTLPGVVSTSVKIVTNGEGKSTLERRHSPYVNPLVRFHAIANHNV